MNITREDTAPREVVLTIQLEGEEIEPFLDRSYRRLVNRVQIAGFRRGKAPRWRVENEVGREALIRESLDSILRETLDKAIKEEEIEAFNEPDVELVEIDPFSLKAVVPLEPIVELGEFRSLRLEPESIEVGGEQVDKVLEQARYDSAPWQPAGRPVKFGDLVTIDVDGVVEGKKVADDKGVDFIPAQDSPFPFPGFSVYLEGMQRDESREFTLQVPEDHRDAELAGKECRFKVKVQEIKEKDLPELDDDFAKGVGEGHESLENLRAHILENLTAEADRISQRTLQEKVLEEVIKGASVEVSQLTTNREIDHLMEGQAQAQQGRQMDVDEYLRHEGKSREELRDELRPEASERLTRFLVIRKLSQEEGIEVPPEEIDAEVERLSATSGDSAESFRQAFSSESTKASFGSAILTRKVLERLALIAEGKAEQEDGAQPDESPSEDKDGEETGEQVASSSVSSTPADHSQEQGGNPGDDQST